MPSRREIIEEARSWVGTPYMHLQRTKGQFCDCIGLIIGLGRHFEFGDYTKFDYLQIPDPVHMGNELRKGLEEIAPSDALPGDIFWFAFRHPRTKESIPRHVGLIGDYHLGGYSLIHAYREAGKVVEHRLDEKWRRRIYSAFRFKGIDDSWPSSPLLP